MGFNLTCKFLLVLKKLDQKIAKNKNFYKFQFFLLLVFKNKHLLSFHMPKCSQLSRLLNYSKPPNLTYGKFNPNYKKVFEICPRFNITPNITYGLVGPSGVCYIGSLMYCNTQNSNPKIASKLEKINKQDKTKLNKKLSHFRFFFLQIFLETNFFHYALNFATKQCKIWSREKFKKPKNRFKNSRHFTGMQQKFPETSRTTK